MYRRIAGYMKENHMTEAGYTVLAGVSGGSDSMLMLTILRELQKPLDFKLAAVHVHHGIRGQEADRDRAFVEQICEKWGIPCHVFHYDVPALSRKWKLGEEETGRLVRREAFEKAAHSYADQKVRIALAHNQEDLAETMLHNLCRGTGLRGLCTMRPTAEKIIRPILCLNRREIADFLKKYQIPHIQDSTNLCDEYTRNRIRHHILPALEQGINSKATVHMAETAFRLSQAEDYLTAQGTELAEKFYKEGRYCFPEEFFSAPEILQIYALQQAMERLAGKRKDITSVHYQKLRNLWNMQTGRKINLPYGMEAERRYTEVDLHVIYSEDICEKKTSDQPVEQRILVPGDTMGPLGMIHTEVFLYDGQKIEEKKYTKWLDYDRIIKYPCIRTRKTGDYIVINSKGDRKKINRCMIDEKIPADRRDQVPLIAVEDEILWIIGSRISERYKITPCTRMVLALTYQGGNKNE